MHPFRHEVSIVSVVIIYPPNFIWVRFRHMNSSWPIRKHRTPVISLCFENLTIGKTALLNSIPVWIMNCLVLRVMGSVSRNLVHLFPYTTPLMKTFGSTDFQYSVLQRHYKCIKLYASRMRISAYWYRYQHSQQLHEGGQRLQSFKVKVSSR